MSTSKWQKIPARVFPVLVAGLVTGLSAQEAAGPAVTEKDVEKTVKTVVADTLKKEKKQSTDITGLVRARFESKSNYGFVDDKSSVADFVGSKAQVGVTRKAGKKNTIRLNLQHSGIYGGYMNSPSGLSTTADSTDPDETTKLGVREAYMETGLGDHSLRIGRQILAFGDQRLIGHLDWTNVGRSHDGFRYRLKTGINELNAFSTVMLENDSSDLLNNSVHNGTGGDQFFSGVYDIVRINKNIHVEPYGLWNHNRYTFEDEHSNLFTLGSRLTNRTSKKGKASGPFDWTLEFAYQTGSLTQDVSVGAWASAVAAGYTLPVSGSWKLRLGAEFDYSPGDEDPTDKSFGRFTNLYPTNHAHYGQMDFISWQNMMGINGNITLANSKKDISFKLAYWNLARASADDNWYAVAGGANIQAIGLKNSETGLFQEFDFIYSQGFSLIQLDVGASLALAGSAVSGALAGQEEANPLFLFVSTTSRF